MNKKFFILLLFLCLNIKVFSEFAYVKRVVDGDTIILQDGRRVRLIGVDTPEVHKSKKLIRDSKRLNKDMKVIQKLGKLSSEFAKQYLHNKKIRLKYDPSNSFTKHKDKYGRTLAYVYFYAFNPPKEYMRYIKKVFEKEITWKPRWLMFNRILIQCGYANAYTRFPYEYIDEFRKYEKEARIAELGLWGKIDGLKQAY